MWKVSVGKVIILYNALGIKIFSDHPLKTVTHQPFASSKQKLGHNKHWPK
jgi:hypothetical protein